MNTYLLWWLWRLTPSGMVLFTLVVISFVPTHMLAAFLLGAGVTVVNVILLLFWVMGRFSPEEVAQCLTHYD